MYCPAKINAPTGMLTCNSKSQPSHSSPSMNWIQSQSHEQLPVPMQNLQSASSASTQPQVSQHEQRHPNSCSLLAQQLLEKQQESRIIRTEPTNANYFTHSFVVEPHRNINTFNSDTTRPISFTQTRLLPPQPPLQSSSSSSSSLAPFNTTKSVFTLRGIQNNANYSSSHNAIVNDIQNVDNNVYNNNNNNNKVNYNNNNIYNITNSNNAFNDINQKNSLESDIRRNYNNNNNINNYENVTDMRGNNISLDMNRSNRINNEVNWNANNSFSNASTQVTIPEQIKSYRTSTSTFVQSPQSLNYQQEQISLTNCNNQRTQQYEPNVAQSRNGLCNIRLDDERYQKQLIVNYLAPTVTSSELYALFAQFGPLDGARIIYDRQTCMPRGYGFVYFRNPLSALNAINSMNGFEFHGKRLKVSYSTNPLNIIPGSQQIFTNKNLM